MKKFALALALALAISPLTFAKADTSAKKSMMHKKGLFAKKSTKTQWRHGPDGVSLYK